MDTTTLADDPAVATDAPPTWSERLAQWLGGFGVSDVEVGDFAVTDIEATEATEPPDEATVAKEAADETTRDDVRASEQGGRSSPELPVLDHPWVLVAPLAGAVVLSAASVLVEPNPLRTGTSPSGLLAFAVLVPFFLLCVAGTLVMVRDAVRLRRAKTEWSPNPWRYVAPSAVALTALHASRVVEIDGAGRPEDLAGLVAGTLVVALAASSILAGPAYLLQRHRRLRER